MSDDPSSEHPLPEGGSSGHLSYGVNTVVIPFTRLRPRGRRPWRRFSGNGRVGRVYPPNGVGQSSAEAGQQLATALKDARPTSTGLVLSAFHSQGAGMAADAGLSGSNDAGGGWGHDSDAQGLSRLKDASFDRQRTMYALPNGA